jgi:hypothetical protein
MTRSSSAIWLNAIQTIVSMCCICFLAHIRIPRKRICLAYVFGTYAVTCATAKHAPVATYSERRTCCICFPYPLHTRARARGINQKYI